MYTKFFGLGRQPFSITPDPAFLFFSRVHELALAHMEDGIQRAGVTTLTGEKGTGKTTIIRYLIEKTRQTHEPALISRSQLDSRSLLESIFKEFEGTDCPENKNDILGLLQLTFIKHHSEGKKSLIVIDEAQDLSPEAFDDLRVLFDLETGRELPVRIILTGRPQLRQLLGKPDLDRLARRISVYFHLANLGMADVSKYIEHRLKTAGYSDPEPLFSEDAVGLIAESSKGVPGVINILCESSLVYAYAENASRVGDNIVRKAIEDHPVLFACPSVRKPGTECPGPGLEPSDGRHAQYPSPGVLSTLQSPGAGSKRVFGMQPIPETGLYEQPKENSPFCSQPEVSLSAAGEPGKPGSGRTGATGNEERVPTRPKSPDAHRANTNAMDAKPRREENPRPLTPDVAMMLSWLDSRIAELEEHMKKAEDSGEGRSPGILRQMEAFQAELEQEKERTGEIEQKLAELKQKQGELQRKYQELDLKFAGMQSIQVRGLPAKSEDKVSRKSIFACFLSLVLGVFGCGSKEEKVASFMAKGDRFIAGGDTGRAIHEYRNALQIDPKSAPAMIKLGKAHLARKEIKQALSNLRAALECDPDADEARIAIAGVFAHGNQGRKALDELAQLRRPENYQTDVLKATALIKLHRYREAIDLLLQSRDTANEKSIRKLLAQSFRATGDFPKMELAVARWRELDTKDQSSYLFMAGFSAEKEDKARAVRELQEMVDQNPGDPGLLLLRARMLEQYGFLEEAESAYEQVSETPDSLEARADFWLRRGDLDKARDFFQKFVSVSNDLNSGLKLASILSKQDDADAAVKLLDSLLKGDRSREERAAILLTKAGIEAGCGRYEEAAKICDEVLGVDQANMDAHLLLGKILLGMRKPAEAEIHLNQVAQARPADGDVSLLLARTQLLNGKESIALGTLKRALDTNPDSNELRMALVRFYFGKKDMEQVLRTLDKGLDRRPEDLMLLRVRGQIEASRRNFAKAERDFRKLIELNPESPLGYIKMGHLIQASSRNNEAVSYYTRAMHMGEGWKEALPALVRLHLSNGDPGSAWSLIESGIAAHPEEPLVYFLAGDILMEEGRTDEAEAAYRKASELAPMWPDPYMGLARLFFREGRLDAVLGRIEARYKQEPQSMPLCLQLAVLNESGGRIEEAINYYRELAEKTSSSSALGNLGFLYPKKAAKREPLEQAEKLANRALADRAATLKFLDASAWISFKLDQLERAWEQLRYATLESPENNLNSLDAALVLDELGRRPEAFIRLEEVIGQPPSDSGSSPRQAPDSNR